MSNCQAIVFDLDGTLLDTLADIAAAANGTLEAFGYQQHPVADYRPFVGSGVRKLFERALPPGDLDNELLERCATKFRERYANCWNDESRPYDGIEELLSTLAEEKIAMAVLSNKPHDFTARCAGHLFVRWQFTDVFGASDTVPHKPDPTGARMLLDKLDVSAERVAYLGDTAVDMQTAVATGMYAIGAAWGFRDVAELREAGAQLIAEHPSDVLQAFAL